MEKQVVVMTYERATKNKYRYQEESSPPVVSTLYIEKYVLGDSPPSRLKVTIDEDAIEAGAEDSA